MLRNLNKIKKAYIPIHRFTAYYNLININNHSPLIKIYNNNYNFSEDAKNSKPIIENKIKLEETINIEHELNEIKNIKNKESIRDLLNEDLINYIKSYKQNEYFRNFPLNNFTENDKSILKSFQNKKTTLLLSNNNTKSRYLLALGILNKLIENKQSFENPENNFSEIISKEDKGLFLSPTTILKNKKIITKQKQYEKPRGALIISEKPEISMIYYRIFRLLDPNKKIRLARIGSSMMAMSPIAEFQDVIFFFNLFVKMIEKFFILCFIKAK